MSMTITVNMAADCLGISDSTMYRLADAGWLPTTRNRKRGYRYVARKALRAFAADPRCWLHIAPRDIPDPELRIVAVAAAEERPGRWWATGALAEHYAVHRSLINVWRRAGWATDATWVTWGNAWWLYAETPPPPPTPRWGNQHGTGYVGGCYAEPGSN